MTTTEHTATTADITRAGRHARTEAGWVDRTDPDYQSRHSAGFRTDDLLHILATSLARAT